MTLTDEELEPDRGNVYRPHKFMVSSGQFWRCKHGFTGYDKYLHWVGCRECDKELIEEAYDAD